ncbi:MAG: hypothetical protein CM1200mP15_08580 [Dehalococcoidia bacterium]|nr:MAG: hypothetical protein CM1200mP15_08580 [Dehalococcoidia bacterium]
MEPGSIPPRNRQKQDIVGMLQSSLSRRHISLHDILVRKSTPESDRVKIYDRVKSPDMWDVEDYQASLSHLTFD